MRWQLLAFLEQVRFLGLRDNPADATPAVNVYEGSYYGQVADLAAELVRRTPGPDLSPKRVRVRGLGGCFESRSGGQGDLGSS